MYTVGQNIVLENEWLRLTVDSSCIARSLICKATGEECLKADEEIALFSVTQNRPYNNEVKLSHPNKRTTFQANRLRLENGKLHVGFEIVPVKAIIEVREAPYYISFKLSGFDVQPKDYENLWMETPPVAELRLIQLAVKDRKNFGEWLNVSWDEKAAVNVLATSPHARIDSERRRGYRLLTADAVREIRLKETEAALVVSTPDRLLDGIASMEHDYGLPHGVESRRSDMINASAYWSSNVTPKTVDEHIRYARMGGFKLMLIYYPAIFKTNYAYDTCGDYDYRPEYPEGPKDLQRMVAKIKEAGITPGIHFLHSHIGIKSRYVTPVADHRLNKTRRFTLSKPLDTSCTDVYVEENPEGTVMVDHCRVLQFGGELISYEGYTTEWPYHFTGCQRGLYDTVIEAHPEGLIGGLVDVSEYCEGYSFYLDQNSSLQDEVADKLAAAYNAGFEYVYFDGSEGTNAPYEFHVPNAQYRVYKKLKPAPLFTEGAAKAHFSWHFLSGGNAFDVFPPKIFKEKICEFPQEEAPRMRQDFTRLNFGWWGFWTPGQLEGDPVGTQPDMFEFGTSRAAAWDCPVTMMEMQNFQNHPRTKDILEVMRRWEDVRAKKWLTEEQKCMLKSAKQEHILLINEEGEYELVPYDQIEGAAKGDDRVRAFIFERRGARYVVYWHSSGSGELALDVDAKHIAVVDALDGAPIALTEKDGATVLPIEGRRYLKSDLSCEALARAFKESHIL